MQQHASIEIERPIETVFRLTSARLADWSSIVVENEILNETPEGVGSTFRTVIEKNGQRMEFKSVVTEHAPPRCYAIRLSCEMFDISDEYLFQDMQGRTRVTHNSRVDGKGWFGVFSKLFGWLMNISNKYALTKDLKNLKDFCEADEQMHDPA